MRTRMGKDGRRPSVPAQLRRDSARQAHVINLKPVRLNTPRRSKLRLLKRVPRHYGRNDRCDTSDTRIRVAFQSHSLSHAVGEIAVSGPDMARR